MTSSQPPSPEITPRESDLPYRPRDAFLNRGELAFYRLLQGMVRERFVICPKVALSEIIVITRPNENVHFYNKIFRKTVDFVLCHPASMRPMIGIQLIRPLGVSEDVRDVDRFLQEVFMAACLPLVSVPTAEEYNLDDVLALFRLALLKVNEDGRLLEEVDSQDFAPICPRCGVSMVLRVHRSGPQSGTRYYGCMNFPQCTETAPLQVQG